MVIDIAISLFRHLLQITMYTLKFVVNMLVSILICKKNNLLQYHFNGSHCNRFKRKYEPCVNSCVNVYIRI